MEVRGAGALVAGGASGLGAATARGLAAAGAVVTIADLDPERGEALAGEIGADFVEADVTDSDAVEAAVKGAAEAGGGLGWGPGPGVPLDAAADDVGLSPARAMRPAADGELASG